MDFEIIFINQFKFFSQNKLIIFDHSSLIAQCYHFADERYRPQSDET